MSLTDWKEIAEIAQALVVILVGAGGAWLYLKRRQRFPRASISHSITHVAIGGDKVLLRVVVKLVNNGEVIIRPKRGFTWVQQILPGGSEYLATAGPKVTEACAINWPMIGTEKTADLEGYTTEVEPTEEQDFCFEFIIPSDVEVISIYSHFKNEKKGKRKIGWNTTSMYKLKDREESAHAGASTAETTATAP